MSTNAVVMKKVDDHIKFARVLMTMDAGFWIEFSSLKLDNLGLDESPIPITGFYCPCNNDQVSKPVTLFSESLPSSTRTENRGIDRNRCPVPGTLYNLNTLEGFHAIDREAFLNAEANKIWDDIHSGKVEEDSSLLLRFLVISFADLKTWSFDYWFAFPALRMNHPAKLVHLRSASECLTPEEARSLQSACNEWRSVSSTTCVPFFLVCFALNSEVTIRDLSCWGAIQKEEGCKVIFGLYDPCYPPKNPGWPLRNYLVYIYTRLGRQRIPFFCYRETRRGLVDLRLSLIGEAVFPDSSDSNGCELDNGVSKCINLSQICDPKRLAISDGNLNLRLMKWRFVPELKLDLLMSCRCLLIGAGTLGCQVAQSLGAWGIQKITIVDYGKVALSNPVRQSLYTLDDCGQYKAIVAAKRLEKSYAAMEVEGIVMAIPMPGHPVSSKEEPGVLEDCKRLQDLIESHDAIFLLTDTRESRWLPSLLSSNANKITITAALGFEEYVVMRHGAGPLSMNSVSDVEPLKNLSIERREETQPISRIERNRLGCYFCIDVVAPTDSTTNRTLDQQCTVTRPGLAPMASGLAAEILVGLLHHPEGIFADADQSDTTDRQTTKHPFGISPHQIRGSVFLHAQCSKIGYASSFCTACSLVVVSEYRKRGLDFILDAINHPTYLEDVSGLTELHRSSDFREDLIAVSDDEDDDIAII